MKTKILIALLASAIAGCAAAPTQEQIQAAEAAEMARFTAWATPLCQSFGYSANTPEHAQCMLTLFQKNAADQRTNEAAAAAQATATAQRFGQALNNIGDGYKNLPPVGGQRTTTNCRPGVVAGSMSCNSVTR